MQVHRIVAVPQHLHCQLHRARAQHVEKQTVGVILVYRAEAEEQAGLIRHTAVVAGTMLVLQI